MRVMIRYKFDRQIEDVITMIEINTRGVFDAYHLVARNESNDLDEFVYKHEKCILVIRE